MQKLRIVSRNSKLALAQSAIIEKLLHDNYPQLITEIIGVTTKGDLIQDRSLEKIGGKGLFVKELELALLNGTSDIAVHSLKDMPAKLAPEFNLVAVLPRADVSDAFVSIKYSNLDSMPDGAIIGTSSVRRSALLAKYYPHLQIKLLRGNLVTRIAKLENNEYDGIILASAGLMRMNLEAYIKEKLSVDKFIPAIGQGALAIEILAERSDLIELLSPLNHGKTLIEVSAEREVGKYLGANCGVPIAVHAVINQEQISINALVLDNNQVSYSASIIGNYTDSLNLAQKCAKLLIDQGVEQILAKYRD